ncbi:DUF4097 family beta strand repeat-containing protein [Streptacidiphilus monticola]|jgi:hypothetical protein|uniref:DUF4097 domain-containing protein n=1 Tax=Streptacidiphilus monticola TaxID=2161674 RepID=A0ABW1GA01_9ACTN
MSGTWTVSTAEKISIDEPVRKLKIRMLAGAVNVVAGEGPARLEISEIEGPAVEVTLADGELVVGYPDLAWKEFGWKSLSGLVDKWRTKRRVVVSVVAPPEVDVEIGSASANTVVSGVRGPVKVNTASGDVTLVRVSGPIETNTVSGAVETHATSGPLKANTVSGALTVFAGGGGAVKANSVSGPMTVDLDRPLSGDVELNNVSGEVAVRIPAPTDTRVQADTTSGDVSSSFDELTVGGMWGAKRITGTLGKGTNRLKITTVSGSVAVLRRPADEEPGEPAAIEFNKEDLA